MKWIDCYYGQSGSAKSESAAEVIRRLHKENGKKARVIVGDGSAATYAALVDEGIVELADYSIRDWPLSTLKQFTEGYWPERPEDPKSPMKAMTPAQFAELGAYVIEGLSVGATYVMGDKKGGFAARAALGEKIAGDSPIQLIDQERKADGTLLAGSGPGFAFGGVTLGGYGHAQRRMMGFIEASKALPGTVIWTAHERAGEDKVSNQKLIGPEVAGGALTAVVSRVFNNTFHFATAEKTAKQTDAHTAKAVDVIDSEFRIYTRDHFRAEGNTYVKYKSVCRHPDPTGKKFLLPDGKPGPELPLYFTAEYPGEAIIKIYEHIKAAHERSKQKAA